jgi:hypothetical protein
VDGKEEKITVAPAARSINGIHPISLNFHLAASVFDVEPG